jgi:hypothetical protein
VTDAPESAAAQIVTGALMLTRRLSSSLRPVTLANVSVTGALLTMSDEYWAPACLSAALVWVVGRSLAGTDETREEKYIPKRRRQRRSRWTVAIAMTCSLCRGSGMTTGILSSLPYRVMATTAEAWLASTPKQGRTDQRMPNGGRRHRRVLSETPRVQRPTRVGTPRETAVPERATQEWDPAPEETLQRTPQTGTDEDIFYEASQSLEQLPTQEQNVDVFTAQRTSGRYATQGRFDSDSFLIAVDNCCSKCITNCMDDFVEPPETVNVRVRGIGGNVTATLVGTVRWTIEDDNGMVHAWTISGTYYNAESPYRLFSPQHHAQLANDHFPRARGTWCGTYDDAIELHWEQRRYKRTIKLNQATNIALVRSAPGCTQFHAFCNEIGKIEATPLLEEDFYCMALTVSDDEASGTSDPDGTEGERLAQNGSPAEESDRRHPDIPDEVFTLSDSVPTEPTTIPEDPDVQYETPQAELLAWHYRLGHVSFAKIKQMAARGNLPAYLGRCKPPKCAACMFGKATRRAWRLRSPANKLTTPPATAPGAVVAIDQMVSATPGLIAQMRGFLTTERYKVTTVFVDHFSGLLFVHMQRSTGAAETVEAKKAFKRHAKAHGVTVRHYHADNGIFAEMEFVRAVEATGQSISYCAVNAHHQNGKAEKKIRDLQELARTQLLHAKQRWPSAVTMALWPYAIRVANNVSNYSPGIKNGISPIESFTQVAVAPRVKHSHTFGSPVYVLRSQLQQAGKTVPKWEEKARIGLLLGFSPRHSRKVALVLNLQTGHVSPQFHCVFDDLLRH